MTLPPIYEQNPVLHSGDRARLDAYKLGLVEALLKEAMGSLDHHPDDAVPIVLRTALDVVRWEPRPRRVD